MSRLDISPTRMELLKLREKLKLALKGQKLLKSKQDALIMNFFQKVKALRAVRKELSGGLTNAFNSLRIAQALDGYSNVKTAAFNYDPTFSLDIQRANIMGVKVPKLEIKEGEHAHDHLGASNQLVETQHLFQQAVSRVIRIAELDNTVRKLADEIKRTKRRLNSLEHKKIPQLSETIAYVKMSLAEAERENFFRLKIIKERLE